MDKRQEEIFAVASRHERGQYLLRRHHPSDDTPSDVALDYDACEALVSAGYARWLPGTSCYYPGVELTGKPLENTTPEVKP